MDVGQTPHFVEKKPAVAGRFPINPVPVAAKPSSWPSEPRPPRLETCFGLSWSFACCSMLLGRWRSDVATWNKIRRSHGWPQARHTLDIVLHRASKSRSYQLCCELMMPIASHSQLLHDPFTSIYRQRLLIIAKKQRFRLPHPLPDSLRMFPGFWDQFHQRSSFGTGDVAGRRGGDFSA